MARKRERYPDVGSVGRSRIVPFHKGEKPMERHGRRLRTNLSYRKEVEGWARRNGYALQIKNEGHHWLFERDGFVAEWWPSSAKLVLNRDYPHGLHVHDWRQAASVLAQRAPAPAERRAAAPPPPSPTCPPPLPPPRRLEQLELF